MVESTVSKVLVAENAMKKGTVLTTPLSCGNNNTCMIMVLRKEHITCNNMSWALHKLCPGHSPVLHFPLYS